MKAKIPNKSELLESNNFPVSTVAINKVNAVIYARTSTEQQAEEDKASIPDQIAWAENLCTEKGWNLVDRYVDTLPGDTEFDLRPEGSRLLEDAKYKKFSLVLFYHSSRLAREPWVGLKTTAILGKYGIQTFVRNAPMEPVAPEKYTYGSNVAAEYLNALSLVGDKQENVARSERVTSGFKNIAQRGTLVFAPYGFKKVPITITTPEGKIEVKWRFEEDPTKGIIVRSIFNDYLKGGTLRGIVKRLIGDKVPSPTGKLGEESWTAATIKNILSNPAYVGQVRWGRKLGSKYKQGKGNSGKQKRVITNPNEWIIAEAENVDKIIDLETFEKVQIRIKQRGKISGKQLASSSLLIGLVHCGDCGRRAHCKTRRVKKPLGSTYIRSDYIDQSYYRGNTCRRHLMASDKLEHLVMQKLQSRLNELNKVDIEGELSKQNKQSEMIITDKVRQIETQLRSYTGKQSRLLDLFVSGGIPKDQFTAKKNLLDSEESMLTEEMQRLQNLAEDQVNKVKALETLKQILNMFVLVKDPQVKKEMLQSIIESVVIYNNKVEVVYKYPVEGSDGLYVKPHPCGFHGDPVKPCTCLPGQISRYQKRLSGPMLDRIDIFLDIPAVKTKDLVNIPTGESSTKIRTRVQKARDMQVRRLKKLNLVANAEMSSRQVKEICALDEESKKLVAAAINKFQISARGYVRILKVARTIADLENSTKIRSAHLAEAIQYRARDVN